MRTIEDAGDQASIFVRKRLGIDDAKVIRAAPGDAGWEVEVEVYEESAFIKALGLHTHVRDRNIYLVKEDDQLNVQSFERKIA